LEQPVVIWEMQQRIALHEDIKAYNQLYDLLSGGLCRFSRSLVKSNEVAEEIVSDVFIKLWQIRARLMDIGNLKVYLYTIARNFSLNYLSKKYRDITVTLDSIDVETTISGPAEMCISADIVRQIRQAIQELPPQCKLVFQLVKEEGLKYKEVAAILDISPLTVRNQLAIAIRKIGEGGKLNHNEPTRVEGLYGREISVARPDGTNTLAVIFYVNERLYIDETTGPSDASSDMFLFLRSLVFDSHVKNRTKEQLDAWWYACTRGATKDVIMPLQPSGPDDPRCAHD